MARQDVQLDNGQAYENHELADIENSNGSNGQATQDKHRHMHLLHHGRNKRLPRGIKPAGESNRRGIHPLRFLKICGRSSSHASMAVNVLWPFVPAGIAVYYTMDHEAHAALIFALNFLAIIPTANLIGFAGQELARKLPIVFGTILECFLGALVEMVLLLILLLRPVADAAEQERNYGIVKDAILGSILANMLLCLGACFWVGGLREHAQKFDGAITEAGTGLLLVVGFALAIPAAFTYVLGVPLDLYGVATDLTQRRLILNISHATAIILLISFVLYVFYQMRSHHNLFASILEADEEQDKDAHRDRHKEKLTLTECIIALVIALVFVCLHAFYLVVSIDGLIATTGVSEMFLGLILVPLVEKAAEHLTAIDEAWDNTPNIALSHILGSTLQTALLNAPLIVLISWGTGRELDFNFSPFQVILLILSILVVGQFLRDGESNYLEGVLCVFVYILIAVAAYYYPTHGGTSHSTSSETSSGTHTTAEGSTGTAEAALATATGHALVLARAALNGAAGRRIL